jgi:hypothetical protein
MCVAIPEVWAPRPGIQGFPHLSPEINCFPAVRKISSTVLR